MATASSSLHLPRDLAPGEWRTQHPERNEPAHVRECWTAEIRRTNDDEPREDGTIAPPTPDTNYWLKITAHAPYGNQSFVLHGSLPQLMALGDMIAEQARERLDAHVEAVAPATRAAMHEAGITPPSEAVEEIIGLGSIAPPPPEPVGRATELPSEEPLSHECDDSCTHGPLVPWGSALNTGASPDEV